MDEVTAVETWPAEETDVVDAWLNEPDDDDGSAAEWEDEPAGTPVEDAPWFGTPEFEQAVASHAAELLYERAARAQHAADAQQYAKEALNPFSDDYPRNLQRFLADAVVEARDQDLAQLAQQHAADQQAIEERDLAVAADVVENFRADLAEEYELTPEQSDRAYELANQAVLEMQAMGRGVVGADALEIIRLAADAVKPANAETDVIERFRRRGEQAERYQEPVASYEEPADPENEDELDVVRRWTRQQRGARA